MIPLQDKKVLNAAKQEIERLRIENAEQKTQIPTMAQEIARNQEIIKLQDINNKVIKDYNNVCDKYEKIIDEINKLKLPAETIKVFQNIIDEPTRNKNQRSRSDEYEM